MLSVFQKSDTYLVRRTLTGHREAFSRLVERYQELVFAVAYGIVAHAADAEDVTQDAFLTAFKRLPDLREPNKFRAWLLTITRNRASDVIVKRRKESPLAELDIAGPDPTDTLADAELRVLLRERVERLPAEHREILLLHYYAGFKVKEIAAQLEISTEAAKKRLQRARDLLSERMLVHLRNTVEEQNTSAARTKSIIAAIAGTTAAYGAKAAASGTALFTAATLIKFASAAVVVSGVVATAILSTRESEPVPPPVAVVPLPTEEVAPTAPMSTPQPPPGAAATVDVDPESDADKSTYPATFTFQGRMVNQAGAAQPGIRVTADSAHESQTFHEETTSDEDGLFSFANLNSEHSYLLQGFGKDAFAAAELYNNDRPRNENEREDLVLLPAADLSGVVVDEKGTPIADASVVPYQVPINGRPEHVDPSWQRLRGVRTDAEGRFNLSHAWLGPWTLQIDSPAHAIDLPELQMPLNAPRTFELKAGASIKGRVIRANTDEGVPALKLAMGNRETTTDEAGHFRIMGLTQGQARVQLRENDSLVIVSKPFEVFSGHETDGVEVEVAVGGVVRGRVTDKTSGEPIEYASVDFIDQTAVETFTAQTGPDGYYEVTRLPRGRYALSSVNGPGHTRYDKSGFTPVDIDYGAQIEGIDFQLSRGVTISGHVDFPEGESRDGVRLTVNYSTEGGGGAFESTIDEQDAFAMSGLPESGTATLRLTGPGWTSDQTASITLASKDVEGIRIVARRDKLATIKGYVTQGANLPRAEERIWLTALDGGKTETTTSKSDGSFTFASIEPGNYRLFIPPYHDKEQLITVRANKVPEGVILDLSGGDAQISGRILDSRGTPVFGARVVAFGHGSFIPDVKTDESGHYTLPGLGDGTYDLTVQADGFGGASRERVTANSRDVDFRLEPVGHAEGTITDARSGKPVSEFEIHIAGTELRAIDYALTEGKGKRQVSAEGNFRAINLNPGDTAIIARAQGYFAGYAIVKVPPGETVSNVAIRLEPAPGLTARVADSEGTAIADAKVFINSIPHTFAHDSFNKEVARTDASGVVSLENLQPGENTLYVYHPVNGRGVFTVDTRSQQGEQLFTLPAPGTLEGRITLGGQAVEHTRLAVSYAPESPIDQFQNYFAEVKEDGTFTVTGLIPGEASLSVDGNGVHVERTLQIASGSITTLDLDLAAGSGTIEITPVLPERLAQAQCTASATIESAKGKIALQSWLQPDGTIRFENVPEGTATVLVSVGFEPGSHTARSFTTDIAEGETISETVDLTRGTSITGHVANVGNESQLFIVLVLGVFEPADLVAPPDDFQLRMTHQAQLGPDGAFQFDTVAPGTYTIFAGADNRSRITHQVVEVEEAELNVELGLP